MEVNNNDDKLERKFTNRSGELVCELRGLFLEHCEHEKDAYDEEDIERIKTDDWFLKRFLITKRRNVQDAFEMMKSTFRLRKEYHIAKAHDYHFPLEFYKSGGLFIYEPDLQGNLILYLRIRMHRQLKELITPTKLFLFHMVEKIDRMTSGKFAVVFDLTGAGYANADLEFLNFLISCMMNNYPVGLRYILIYNLNWILNTFRRPVYSVLPKELKNLVKFASGNEIFDFIDEMNLPDFLGGKCRRNYMAFPKGCQTVLDLCQSFNVDRETVLKHMPMYKELLDESERKLESGYYIDPENFFDEKPSREDEEESGIICEDDLEILPNNKIIVFHRVYFGNNHYYDDANLSEPEIVEKSSHQAEVILHNKLNESIAFKFQTNYPHQYTVSPSRGIVLAHSYLLIKIKVNDDISKRKYRNGRFLVYSRKVETNEMTMNEFEDLWHDEVLVSKTEVNSMISTEVASDDIDFGNCEVECSNNNALSVESERINFAQANSKVLNLNYTGKDKKLNLPIKYQTSLIAVFVFLVTMFMVFLLENHFGMRFVEIVSQPFDPSVTKFKNSKIQPC